MKKKLHFYLLSFHSCLDRKEILLKYLWHHIALDRVIQTVWSVESGMSDPQLGEKPWIVLGICGLPALWLECMRQDHMGESHNQCPGLDKCLQHKTDPRKSERLVVVYAKSVI